MFLPSDKLVIGFIKYSGWTDRDEEQENFLVQCMKEGNSEILDQVENGELNGWLRLGDFKGLKEKIGRDLIGLTASISRNCQHNKKTSYEIIKNGVFDEDFLQEINYVCGLDKSLEAQLLSNKLATEFFNYALTHKPSYCWGHLRVNPTTYDVSLDVINEPFIPLPSKVLK